MSGPVFNTLPTKQEELILINFKLVLINKGLTGNMTKFCGKASAHVALEGRKCFI